LIIDAVAKRNSNIDYIVLMAYVCVISSLLHRHLSSAYISLYLYGYGLHLAKGRERLRRGGGGEGKGADRKEERGLFFFARTHIFNGRHASSH
jgi:hypothetical protein